MIQSSVVANVAAPEVKNWFGLNRGRYKLSVQRHPFFEGGLLRVVMMSFVGILSLVMLDKISCRAGSFLFSLFSRVSPLVPLMRGALCDQQLVTAARAAPKPRVGLSAQVRWQEERLTQGGYRVQVLLSKHIRNEQAWELLDS